MKKFKVIIQCRHETFNGYDVNDENKSYIVEARNENSACNKAIKIFNKTYYHTRKYSRGILSVKELK